MRLWILSLLALILVGCRKPPPPPVVRLPLVIESTPSGATVTLDDHVAPSTTPLEAQLAPGPHWVQLDLDGYETQYFAVVVKPPTTPTPISAVLDRITAGVMIDSEPSGASLKLDGQSLDATPAVAPTVPVGTHKLTLSLAGHADQERTFEVRDSRPQPLRYDLVSLLANVQIFSNPPGTSVSLDGDPKGQTPESGTAPLLIRDVPEGEHVVTLRRSNYEDVSQHFVLIRGETKVIQPPPMKPLPGGVTIASVPTGAKVIVNGDVIGNTPYTFSGQAPGTNISFRLEAEGYAPTSGQTTIVAGITKQLDMTLGKEAATLLLITEPAGADVFFDSKKIGTTEKSDNPSVSKVFTYEPIEPGQHVIMIVAPAFQKKGGAQLFLKGETKSLRVVLEARWLATHTLVTKGGKTQAVKIIRTNADGSVEVEPSKGTTITYKKDEIVSITPL